MKKYESYAKSGLFWLQSIPSHWQVEKIGKLFSQVKCKDFGLTETNLLSLSYGTVKRRNINATEGLLPESFEGYNIIESGDIVLRLTDLQNDQKSLRTGLSTERGIITSAYITIRNRSDNLSEYLQMFLHVFDIAKGFYNVGASGVRQGLGWDDIKQFKIAIPPRKEQDQIVRFLNWKVSAINRLISVRRRQIKELEGLERSQVGHLIMGRSKDISQRETAVSWAKTIPAHWSEKSLIQFAEKQQIKNTGMIENNLLSLSYGKIINKDINTTDGLLPASFEGYQIVHEGNIILRLTDLQNDQKSLRTGFVTQTGIITSAYVCLKVRAGILPEYLQLQLHVADLCKVFYGMGGGVRQSIGFNDIRSLLIAIPPIDEQQSIIELVHSVEDPINRAIRKCREIITTLEELKNRLLSDVVTGRIDVSGIEIPEFEYMEETDLTGESGELDYKVFNEEEEECLF